MKCIKHMIGGKQNDLSCHRRIYWLMIKKESIVNDDGQWHILDPKKELSDINQKIQDIDHVVQNLTDRLTQNGGGEA